MRMQTHSPDSVGEPPVVGCTCGWVGVSSVTEKKSGTPAFDEWLESHLGPLLQAGLLHGLVGASVAPDLIQAWANFPKFYWPSSNAHSVALGWGWWCRANRAADAFLALFNRGLTTESVALLRVVFEHTLYLQALRRMGKDAFDAATHEHWRSNRNLFETSLGGPIDLSLHGVSKDDLLDAEPQFDRTSSWTQEVQGICRKFGNSNDLYAFYRLLSGLVHPTLMGSMLLVEGQEADSTLEDDFRREPELAIESDLLYWNACLLTWAGQAFAGLVGGDFPITEELEVASRKLGIPTFEDFSGTSEFGAINVTADELHSILFPEAPKGDL